MCCTETKIHREGIRGQHLEREIDKVDNIDRKDLLREKEKNIKDSLSNNLQ